jgi:competence protein ComGC
VLLLLLVWLVWLVWLVLQMLLVLLVYHITSQRMVINHELCSTITQGISEQLRACFVAHLYGAPVFVAWDAAFFKGIHGGDGGTPLGAV